MKMNKKIVMPIMLILGISFVAAISYYALFSASFTVLPSIVMDDCSDNLIDVYTGEVIVGSECSVTNNAPTEREILISNDGGEDIEISYKSNLLISQKVVDFELDVWETTGDTANVEYTVVGDSFTVEITSGEKTGYVLVYYKDNSDRFNSPATAIGIDSIVGNLAYEDDANKEDIDYCETEEYVTCHGAKLWYLDAEAIDEFNNVDWSQASDFLFETSLIQYNAEGNIVIYPSQTLTLTPVYTIGNYVEEGEYTVTTTVA